jgi:hypothetical protein
MIIDGETSVIGSDDRAVEAAVSAAENNSVEIPVSIAKQADGNLKIAIGGGAPAAQVPAGAAAWEVHFNRGGYTNVERGENGGQMLESTNNVMRYVPMSLVAGRENDYVLPGNYPEDGVAVLLQKQPFGRIIGAAVFLKPVPAGQRADAR